MPTTGNVTVSKPAPLAGIIPSETYPATAGFFLSPVCDTLPVPQ